MQQPGPGAVVVGTGRRGGGQEEEEDRRKASPGSGKENKAEDKGCWGESYQGGIVPKRICQAEGQRWWARFCACTAAPAAAGIALTLRVFGPCGVGFQPETDPEVKASASQHLPLRLTHPVPLGAKSQQL